MAKELQFILDNDSMQGMGRFIDGVKSLISPLSQEKHLNNEQLAKLIEIGILDANGMLCEDYLDTLETLAGTDCLAQARLDSKSIYLDATIYFSPDFKSSVSIFAREKELLIQNPAPVRNVANQLRHVIGESPFLEQAFQAQLASISTVP